MDSNFFLFTRRHVLTFTLFASILSGCTTDQTPTGNAGAGADGATRFFLPTGEPTNTSAPSIEIDREGGIHAVYPEYAGGGAFYAYCPSSCTGPEQMKIVPFATDGTVHNAMLALDAEGRPQVLLSTYAHVYYAKPSGDPSDASSWATSIIVEHAGEREISGEAFALDRDGRPRFLMHVYKAYLGVGQKPPATYYVTCDADCSKAASWKTSQIDEVMWRGSNLRIDAQGVAHVATVATVDATETTSGTEMVAYLRCESACDQKDSWKGISFLPAYESEIEAVRVTPAVSLALTKTGAPRVAFIGLRDGKKSVAYFECDADCSGDHWRAVIVSEEDKIGAGVDLALDSKDHPRLAYTLNYNIGLAYCDALECGAPNAPWDLVKVELGSEMKPDEIFLYENCNVGAWFLHSPSIALDPQDRPRVGYQARDISAGDGTSSPSRPKCVAGTDMTWSRLALLPEVK